MALSIRLSAALNDRSPQTLNPSLLHNLGCVHGAFNLLAA